MNATGGVLETLLVSHVSVKVRWEANTTTACTKPRHTHSARAGELKASRNEEDGAKPHCVYRSGLMVVHAVEAPSQLATDALQKREMHCPAETQSLVMS